ncbi:MAG: hypothetical protein QM286_12625, partial [Acidobacteriota bacterium]|nr:hypothetical protein [Acidobacteriota bacterium]
PRTTWTVVAANAVSPELDQEWCAFQPGTVARSRWSRQAAGHRVVAGVDGDLAVTAQMIPTIAKCSNTLTPPAPWSTPRAY